MELATPQNQTAIDFNNNGDCSSDSNVDCDCDSDSGCSRLSKLALKNPTRVERNMGVIIIK